MIYGRPEVKPNRDVWRVVIRHQKDGEGHPCPKLLLWWLKVLVDFSQRGDLVLDPFLGSGTTALAAALTGRRCIGIELNKDYCNLAVRRLVHNGRQHASIAPSR